MAVERSDAMQGETVHLRVQTLRAGTLFDPFSIGPVQILDASLALVATIAAGTVVQDGVGRYRVDWDVPLAEPIETHHDRWTSVATNGAVAKQFTRDFYVRNFSLVTAGSAYVEIGFARSYLPSDTALTDAAILEDILNAQEIIETCAGQNFLPVVAARVFDGSGEDYQPVDLIRPDSVTLIEYLDSSGTWSEQTIGDLRYPNSRRALTIGNALSRRQMMLRGRSRTERLLEPLSCGYWPAGTMNVRVTGAWGRYASVPRQIQMAIGLLVRYAGSCLEPGERDAPANAFLSESVPEGRTYTLRQIGDVAAQHRQTGFPDVDSIIARFRPVGTVATVM